MFGTREMLLDPFVVHDYSTLFPQQQATFLRGFACRRVPSALLEACRAHQWLLLAPQLPGRALRAKEQPLTSLQVGALSGNGVPCACTSPPAGAANKMGYVISDAVSGMVT